MTKEKVKQYALFVSVIFIVFLIISLFTAFVTLFSDNEVIAGTNFGINIAIPAAFLISGAAGQYYVSRLTDFFICLLVNIVGSLMLFVPFLVTFAEDILKLLLYYWMVFLLGFVICLMVRQITNFINFHSNKKS